MFSGILVTTLDQMGDLHTLNIGSTLAKRMREAEDSLMAPLGINCKLWREGEQNLMTYCTDQGLDCERPGWLLRSTKQYSGKNTSQECPKETLRTKPSTYLSGEK